MNKLFFFFALILSLTTTNNSSARSILAAQKAEFTEIDFPLDLSNPFISGNMTIDYINSKIKINLMTESICPANVFCDISQIMTTFSAPLISRKVGACGEFIYTAHENKMPVDGNDLTIIVTDNHFLKCKMLPLAPVVVKISKKFYDRLNGKLVKNEGTLLADSLIATGPIGIRQDQ